MKLQIYVFEDQNRVQWIATTFLPTEGVIFRSGETPAEAKAALKIDVRERLSRKALITDEIDI